MLSRCTHAALTFDPSSNAKHAGYTRRTQQQRIAAARPSGRASKAASEEALHDDSTFPAPLVLPGDDLSWDPKYDAQSLKSWLQLPERNRVTDDRRTIYVAPVPSVAAEIKHVREWVQPMEKDRSSVAENSKIVAPSHENVVEFIAAFYTNIPVKILSEPALQFTSWDNKQPAKKRTEVSYIALSIGSEAVRIRARQSKDGVFSNQLNLDDLLDAAISLLPPDAYALLLLVEHDLYEEEDDDFCCGRAYGGSRVAVVSSARYNPALDVAQKVEVEHAWPASHCQAYVDSCLEDCGFARSPSRKKAKTSTKRNQVPTQLTSALRAAVSAFATIPATSQSDAALWLSRICKTASHELGHCFGMDHCIYYACSMQGSAGLSEDARQPPYLCPVDLSKVLRATGADANERYKALLRFCQRFKSQDRGFAAFAAWLRLRIADTTKAAEKEWPL